MSTPAVINRVRRGFYLDSVALMQLSRAITGEAGVESAALMIGTDANRALLEDADLLRDAGREAGPNDLIIAVRAVTPEAAERAFEAARGKLETRVRAQPSGRGMAPKGIDAAIGALDGANLVLISVPGTYAAAEARKALRRGLNVMLFSDQVPVEEELALKEEAIGRGLWLLGPDAGSAIIGGARLGFVNAVPRGDVGIVAGSGTGLQEVSVLLARGGRGISHAIGVGGRDLSDAVGGIMTLAAIDALEADPGTARIALLSKPPGARAAARVEARIRGGTKPVTVCFVGAEAGGGGDRIFHARTLTEAADHLLGRAGADPGLRELLAAAPRPSPGRGRWIRGLFSGGTLCAEAQVVLRAAGETVCSNAPIPGVPALPEDGGGGHRLLDLGADEFTIGRPHPMIDPDARRAPLLEALADREVAVILLDLVLGYAAHPDPAGAVAEGLRAASGGGAAVVASVCGTETDPQVRSAQVETLRAAEVVVAGSNAQATELALALARGDGET